MTFDAKKQTPIRNMLAFQHIAPLFVGQQHSGDARIKRSVSPTDLCNLKRENSDLTHSKHMRRRSLSRPCSPASPHSPKFSMKYYKENSAENLIKRSLSEEDLRHVSHVETRRLSVDRESDDFISERKYQIIRPIVKYPEMIDNDSDNECKNSHEQSDEQEDEPLDLSMKRRGRTDSGTDSDDSAGLGEEGREIEGRAYKKNLMKRYCEFC